MVTIVAIVVVLANLLTAGRLIFYRRKCSRYRFGMAALAYLMIVCSGGRAIDVVVNSAPVTVWEAGFAAVIALLVWRSKGNVANIMRCGHA